jgi:hypothetical protein
MEALVTSRIAQRVFRVVAVTALTVSVATLLGVSTASAKTAPGVNLAHELLAQIIVPPAAVLAHPTTAVVCQCVVASGTVTSEHRYYIVPGSPANVEKFLSTHIPHGGRFDGKVDTTGSSDAPLGMLSNDDYVPREWPPHLSKAVGLLHDKAEHPLRRGCALTAKSSGFPVAPSQKRVSRSVLCG